MVVTAFIKQFWRHGGRLVTTTSWISMTYPQILFSTWKWKKSAEVQEVKITIQCKILDKIGWNLEWCFVLHWRKWLHKRKLKKKNYFLCLYFEGLAIDTNLSTLTKSKIKNILNFFFHFLHSISDLQCRKLHVKSLILYWVKNFSFFVKKSAQSISFIASGIYCKMFRNILKILFTHGWRRTLNPIKLRFFLI